MNKIKKIFQYFLGMFLTYAFSQGVNISFAVSNINSVDWAVYGPPAFQVPTQQNTLSKICSIIFTPINILILIVIAIIIGTYIYHRKKKNIK